ncbi:MAG: hypothetical protein R2798_11050 [Chitinophagales bacterium]|nr:hypothetical protein [Bacteroidota bacterium]MCB9043257.1 hypothetical protein [Chitinophagales bacterium]
MATYLVFLIPIIAILAGVYQKIRTKELEMSQATGEVMDITQKLTSLQQENKQLQQRIENLETIITHLDENVLLLNAVTKDSSPEKVEKLAQKMAQQ